MSGLYLYRVSTWGNDFSGSEAQASGNGETIKTVRGLRTETRCRVWSLSLKTTFNTRAKKCTDSMQPWPETRFVMLTDRRRFVSLFRSVIATSDPLYRNE